MKGNNTLSDSLFWQDLYNRMKDSPKWVRINGESFIFTNINDIPPKGWNKYGHSNTKGYAKLRDGSVIRSENIWYQGKIPEEFKELIPDNAEYASEKEFDNAKIVGFCFDCGLIFTDRMEKD